MAIASIVTVRIIQFTTISPLILLYFLSIGRPKHELTRDAEQPIGHVVGVKEVTTLIEPPCEHRDAASDDERGNVTALEARQQ
ncbi:hypothetical protein VZC37_15465 [Gordonia sp. LSe1-13]|uniref:Secreted protein n=1 Tax=Gordonia sesuvii TaxID=3116777 RepID=A0ABU7MF46_9ACTN|nr:hypothetical protein [Gordonia sp. LSe1-13]